MDHLQRTTGAQRFVLCGLCSGADNAIHVALIDRRVAAIALIDPYGYRTARSRLNWFLQRARNSGSPGRFAKRTAHALMRTVRQRLLPDSKNAQPAPDLQSLARETPSRGAFAAQLGFIVDQGTQVFLIYSGGGTDDYNYAGQFDDAFRWYGLAGRVRSEYAAICNHTFTELEHQRVLVESLIAWGEGLFAAAPPDPDRQTGPRS
jgi:hypothetical protein